MTFYMGVLAGMIIGANWVLDMTPQHDTIPDRAKYVEYQSLVLELRLPNG